VASDRWTWPLRLRRGAWVLAATLALAGCGGGGGGGRDSDELAVTLGQPGPGDPENYLPLAVGNLWIFRGTVDAGGWTLSADTTVRVTGTRSVDGVAGLVLRETDAQTPGEVIEQVLVKDANGVAVLDEDGDGPTLAPYWDLRLPLQPGTEFVQLDRRNVDLGEDIDGDGVHERADLRSVVRVVGFETVTVPAGTFANAVRLERRLRLTITLTSTGDEVTATEEGVLWLARDVGWVRRTSELRLLGETIRVDELLEAYVVGAATGGMTEATQATVAGALAAGERRLWLFRDRPASGQTMALTGLTGDADLSVLTATGCLRSSGALPGTAPEDCSFEHDAGPVVAAVSSATGARVLLSLAPTPSMAAPVDENRVVTAGGPVAGQVGPRGESRYAVTGLAAGDFNVAIFGLNADADLKVYADDTYSTELDCTLQAPGDVLPTPSDCTTASTGSLTFAVRSGELETAGASFLLLVHPAP
jgi:hypothetical protein